jgi:hypothetical protein
VITKEKVIVIADEYKNFGIDDPSKWKPAFLKYGAGMEGLFFIPAGDSRSSLPVRNANFFAEEAFNNPVDHSVGWKFICSWRDSGKDNLRFGIVPRYTGLNDCAHFVSECLSKAGLNVLTPENRDVNKLIKSLEQTGAVKILAKLTDKDRARRILQSDIMTPGDVLAFGVSDGHHRHSALYLGGEAIAMHTYINHPTLNNDKLVKTGAVTGKKSNWETAANSSHPLVTLIHFSYSDPSVQNSPRVGWWNVTWQGQNYYYYFDKSGRAGYVTQKPKDTRKPLVAPESKGYWFEKGTNLSICWTSTGSLEEFPLLTNGPRLTGTWNDTPGLVAVKM